MKNGRVVPMVVYSNTLTSKRLLVDWYVGSSTGRTDTKKYHSVFSHPNGYLCNTHGLLPYRRASNSQQAHKVDTTPNCARRECSN